MSDTTTTDLTVHGATTPREQVQNDHNAELDEASITPQRRTEAVGRDAPVGRSSGDCDKTTNVVEIVGTVMQQRRSDKGRVARTQISPTRAVTAQLALQVHEEDGEVYGLQLVFPPRVAIEAGLIEALAEGERVQVRGRLSWRDTYDLRYASAEHPMGRAARQLAVTVLELARAEARAVDGSWVRVEGSVLVPPQIRPHETSPGLRVARTSLQVTMRLPSTRPGSRAEFIETANIPVDMPIDLPSIGAVLRAGNLVALEGRLERYRQRIHPERSEPISEAIATVRTRHTSESAQLTAEGREAARRRGARELRALLYEDRLRLRVGYIEMIEGTMLNDLEQVIRNRREWTAQVQTRRARFRQQGTADLDNLPEHLVPTRSDSAP